jgi:hypothetical protein
MVGKGLIREPGPYEAPGILRSQRRSPSFVTNVGSPNYHSLLLQGTLSVIPILFCFVCCLLIQSKLLALSFLIAAVYAHGLDEWNNEPTGTPRVQRVGFIEGTKFTRAPRPLSRKERENMASRQTQEIIRLIDKRTGIKTLPWSSSGQTTTATATAVDLRSMRVRLKRACSIKNMKMTTNNSPGHYCHGSDVVDFRKYGRSREHGLDHGDLTVSTTCDSSPRSIRSQAEAAESRDDNTSLQNSDYEESDNDAGGEKKGDYRLVVDENSDYEESDNDAEGEKKEDYRLVVDDKPGCFGPSDLIDECGTPEEMVMEALSLGTTFGTLPDCSL